jgi:hypothetical protein
VLVDPAWEKGKNMKGVLIGAAFGALLALIIQPLLFPDGFLSDLQQGFNTVFRR